MRRLCTQYKQTYNASSPHNTDWLRFQDQISAYRNLFDNFHKCSFKLEGTRTTTISFERGRHLKTSPFLETCPLLHVNSAGLKRKSNQPLWPTLQKDAWCWFLVGCSECYNHFSSLIRVTTVGIFRRRIGSLTTTIRWGRYSTELHGENEQPRKPFHTVLLLVRTEH